MPNAPKTPTRPMRIPDDEWDEYGDAVKQVNSNRTEITREFMRWFMRRPGAKLPKRPDKADEPENPT